MKRKRVDALALARACSKGEVVLGKLNGHGAPEDLDLSALGECAEHMIFFGNSFPEFRELPNGRQMFLRGAVKAALRLDSLPDASRAFGVMLNLRGECRNERGPAQERRGAVRRFLNYCHTREVPSE